MGYLAAAVIAVIALVGAPSAAAKNVTLCKENLKECPEKSRYPSNTTIAQKLAEGTKAVFTTSLGKVECAKSEMEGVTEKQEGSVLDGTIAKATFGECKMGASACTVSAAGLPWWREIVRWSPWWHERWWWHTTGARPQISFSCSGGLSCTYGNEPVGELEWIGGGPASISASEVKLESDAGLFCTESMTFTAKYTVTSPNPVWVTEVT